MQKCINAVRRLARELDGARVYQGKDCYVRTIYDLSGGDFYGAVLRDNEILGVAKTSTKYAFQLNEEVNRIKLACKAGFMCYRNVGIFSVTCFDFC